MKSRRTRASGANDSLAVRADSLLADEGIMGIMGLKANREASLNYLL